MGYFYTPSSFHQLILNDIPAQIKLRPETDSWLKRRPNISNTKYFVIHD
jgi:hypothetical protein